MADTNDFDTITLVNALIERLVELHKEVGISDASEELEFFLRRFRRVTLS